MSKEIPADLSEAIVRQADLLEREGTPLPLTAQVLSERHGIVVKPSVLQDALDAYRHEQAITARASEFHNSSSGLGNDHDDLLWVRALIRARLENPDLPHGAFVDLAREFRQNIQSGQELATMTDRSGQFRFMIVYGNSEPSPLDNSKTLDVPGRIGS